MRWDRSALNEDKEELGITRDFRLDLGKEAGAHSIFYTSFSLYTLLTPFSIYLAVSTSFSYSESQLCFPFRNQLSIAQWITMSNDWRKALDSLCLVHRSIPDLVNSVQRDRVTRQDPGKWETMVCGKVTRRLFKWHTLLETTWQISFNTVLPFKNYVLVSQTWLSK